MKKSLFLILLTFMLCACGANQKIYNLEKEGEAYNYSEKIFFYYPREWQLKIDTLKLSLDITNPKQEEGLYFDTFEVDVGNHPSGLMELYVSKLKNLGLEVQEPEEQQLESLQPCFFVKGYCPKDDTRFCEVVLFLDGQQYIYSYIAKSEVYVKNEETMLLYLESLVVNDVQKTSM